MPRSETETKKIVKDHRLKLGEKVKQVREQRGYSLEQLADKMNMSRSLYRRLNMANLVLVWIFYLSGT